MTMKSYLPRRNRARVPATGLSLVCFATVLFGQPPTLNSALKLNQIQIIGTHNSYHAGLTVEESAFIRKTDRVEADALDYRHQSLTSQLDAGMRELEIDINADPTGGSFDRPRIQTELAAAGVPDAPFPYPKEMMDRPGFKVMHKARTDFRSNCQPFTACLEEIAQWSDRHQGHVPIYLFIEAKDGSKFTAGDSDELDEEIRSVFPRQKLFVPEDLLKGHATLRQAVADHGWPELEAVRGKVIFLMSRADVTKAYESGHPGLKGRILFTNGPLDDPNTAYAVVPDPHDKEIPQLVRSGYLVYTRADADTAEARTKDETRQKAAFASGAQIISTDYPTSEPSPWSGYTVAFPGHVVARCNPVNTVQPCSLTSPK